jgi:hypothetical protein
MRRPLQLQSNCSRVSMLDIEAHHIEADHIEADHIEVARNVPRRQTFRTRDGFQLFVELGNPRAGNLPYYMQAQKRHFSV